MPAQRALLPDGRSHFQHGPMISSIAADGRPDALQASHAAAWERFETILEELVGELAVLRRPVGADPCPLRGAVARRMWSACRPYRAGFITPMAAVAGAVAQELIGHYARPGVDRAWINNGGDIALHLAPERSVRIGLYADIGRLDAAQLRDGIRTDGWFDVGHELPVRGVATSGWRGRSFSLGIADSVTVLARSAAEADAAATVIANAVDVDDARIVRRPACELKDDSDLGSLPVTVDVPRLDRETVQRALSSGRERAQTLHEHGLIWSCALVCQGMMALAGAHGAAAAGTLPRTGVAAHAH